MVIWRRLRKIPGKTKSIEDLKRRDDKQRIMSLINGLGKNERIYPDEIANKLKIDFQLVMQITDELEKGGKITIEQ